ncbi:MAG: hypothetical protein WD182_01930 [Bacteroidota bacterium]
MRILLLFVDGVGIGKPLPDVNPFFRANVPCLRSLLDGELPSTRLKRCTTTKASLVPVNATLGIPGLPQSGTGQTAIFTGVNAPRMIGRHFGPHPTTTLRPVIEAKNIFRQLKERGLSVCFVNAFPKQFFDYVEAGNRRLSVTTLSCQFAGVPLLRTDSLRRNHAVSADITRAQWPEKGDPPLPTVTPEEAGRHCWDLARKHDFTLFEYWLTDYVGHSRDMAKAVEVLERFDGFMGGLLEEFDHTGSLMILVSDHGNLEDLSTKSHTRNQVPCIAVGERRNEFVARIKNLTHITPTILRFLDGSWEKKS